MKTLRSSLPGAVLAVSATALLAANEFSGALTSVAKGTIAAWVHDPAVIAAVTAQNATTAAYSEARILELDADWRAQTVTGGALIDTVLGNPLSAHLARLKAQGGGRFTEIFVTDARGLNVGQSDVTSDYWQGDEAKWQVPTETRAAHFGEVEFDESTQTYQSQISLPIIDGGSVIGVITVGVDVQRIASN